MSSRLNYGPLANSGPEDNDPGTAFIIHNVDDTVTIKVRSPGDRVFSEIEMPIDAWIKLRSVGGNSPAAVEIKSVCPLCLGTGKVFHENPPRKDTPWSRCHCGGTLAGPHHSPLGDLK